MTHPKGSAIDVVSVGAFGQTLLAGTSPIGLVVSSDDGATWGPPNLNGLVVSMLADGANVYAGTEDGVFKSTNAGASWSALGSLPSPTRVQSMTAFNGQLYGGMYSNGVWHHAL